MEYALYEDFVRFEKGKVQTFHYQELNPSDRSKVKLFEIVWTHDRVEGDLMFGEMRIEGLGQFKKDAYLYRMADLGGSEDVERVCLAWTDTEPVIGPHEQRFLTGGHIYKRPLLPSEIYASADRRSSLDGSDLPRVVHFKRDEHDKLCKWTYGIEQKGFKCITGDVGRGYAIYLKDDLGSVSLDLERGGLEFNMEVRRVKAGLFSANYQIHVVDKSYRHNSTNRDVINARPGCTHIVSAQFRSFDEMRTQMDEAVDLIVERNVHFSRREI